MAFPRRVHWLEGKFSNVDGIPFTMPIATHWSRASTTVDMFRRSGGSSTSTMCG